MHNPITSLATYILDRADQHDRVAEWLRHGSLGHFIYARAERIEARSQGQTPWF